MQQITRLRAITLSTLITLSLVAGQAFARPQPLQVEVFIHQDVKLSAATVYKDYLQHWENAMLKISDREVNFEFFTDSNIITTLPYQSEDKAAVLADLIKFASWHRQANPKQGQSTLRKVLLITQQPINSSTLGVTQHLGDTGIASLATYIAPAHELGHMFGASHDNARSGWTSLCDSYMTARRNPLKAHCYAFSEANEDAISEHLGPLH